jgi:hypothetical protein
MQTTWTFNEKELRTLLAVFGRNDLFGVEFSDEKSEDESDMEATQRSLLEKGLFEEQNGKMHLETAIEVSLLAMIDKQVGISMQIEGKSKYFCNLYFHGETIVLLRNKGEEEYEIMWIPFIPGAIYEAYGFYKESMIFPQFSQKSVMVGKSRSALASKSVCAGKGPVLTAMVKILAAAPARIPSGAFSTTKAS